RRLRFLRIIGAWPRSHLRRGRRRRCRRLPARNRRGTWTRVMDHSCLRSSGSTNPTRFGFCVPIFAYPGPALFRTPSYERLDPQTSLAAAVECERLGYDSLWVADHFFHGHDGAILEGWTTLCVLAGLTSRIRLGS